jgi:hypothetical protein
MLRANNGSAAVSSSVSVAVGKAQPAVPSAHTDEVGVAEAGITPRTNAKARREVAQGLIAAVI